MACGEGKGYDRTSYMPVNHWRLLFQSLVRMFDGRWLACLEQPAGWRVWNSLLQHVTSAPTLQVFKVV